MATAATNAFRAKRQPYDRKALEAASQTTTRFVGRLQYDGTEYVGWQTQQSGLGVQDALEVRLSALLGGRVYVAGSGRTDKGVHAQDQVFHFELPRCLDASSSGDDSEPLGKVRHHQLAAALSASDDHAVADVLERVLTGPRSELPPDLQVMSIGVAPPGFHARDSCVGKRYVYTVEEGMGSPFTSRYRWTLGRGRRLDVSRMAEAAALLVGTHDFSTFGVRDADDPRSPMKRMRRLEVRRMAVRDALSEASRGGIGGSEGEAHRHDGPGGVVTICAECDRFLYNMMRMLSGTLVQVGLGNLSVEAVGQLLGAKGRKVEIPGAQVFKAPAHGLCLERCFLDYEDGEWTDAPAGPVPTSGGSEEVEPANAEGRQEEGAAPPCSESPQATSKREEEIT